MWLFSSEWCGTVARQHQIRGSTKKTTRRVRTADFMLCWRNLVSAGRVMNLRCGRPDPTPEWRPGGICHCRSPAKRRQGALSLCRLVTSSTDSMPLTRLLSTSPPRTCAQGVGSFHNVAAYRPYNEPGLVRAWASFRGKCKCSYFA